MIETPLSSFQSPTRHQAISELIRLHSSNRTDVRRVALEGLDLSSVREVLDLGCGFGFMSEAVASRVAREARMLGVDACASNEVPFLDRVAQAGRTGAFALRTLGPELEWPDDTFDLVIASYSLYFFPELLPEISRVLAPGGLFLTITHFESSCRSLLQAVGRERYASRLQAVIRRFSAENGAEALSPCFGRIERIDYENQLSFGAGDFDDLLTFLRFKLPMLSPPGRLGHRLGSNLETAARVLLARGAPVRLEKNDSIFRCWEPRWA